MLAILSYPSNLILPQFNPISLHSAIAGFIVATGHDELFESCPTSVEIYVLETFVARFE